MPMHSGNLEVSGAGCQVLAAESLRYRHGGRSVLERPQASLEAIFKLISFDENIKFKLIIPTDRTLTSSEI